MVILSASRNWSGDQDSGLVYKTSLYTVCTIKRVVRTLQSVVMTSDPCLLGNHLDRHKVFLMSFGSRKRQMDGEPKTSRSSQQRQQQEGGERSDGVGHRGQRPARKEEVGVAAPDVCYTLKSTGASIILIQLYHCVVTVVFVLQVLLWAVSGRQSLCSNVM